MNVIAAHLASTVPAVLGVAIAALGAIALGWAIFRAQALSGWRAAAEGYRAQVDEMTPRLERAEQLAVSLQSQITELEARPDLRQVLAGIGALGGELRTGLTEIRELLGGAAPHDP